jgi:hypothetical protein
LARAVLQLQAQATTAQIHHWVLQPQQAAVVEIKITLAENQAVRVAAVPRTVTPSKLVTVDTQAGQAHQVKAMQAVQVLETVRPLSKAAVVAARVR